MLGSDCLATQAAVIAETIGQRPMARLDPDEIETPVPSVDYRGLLFAPGDGRVTRESALAGQGLSGRGVEGADGPFPLTYAMMICEAHDQLTENVDVQAAVLRILLGGD